MIVACLQYRSLHNENDTLKKILPLIEESARLNVDLIALPECATFLRKNKFETLNDVSPVRVNTNPPVCILNSPVRLIKTCTR